MQTCELTMIIRVQARSDGPDPVLCRDTTDSGKNKRQRIDIANA
jgi:hypothetical protein